MLTQQPPSENQIKIENQRVVVRSKNCHCLGLGGYVAVVVEITEFVEVIEVNGVRLRNK